MQIDDIDAPVLEPEVPQLPTRPDDDDLADRWIQRHRDTIHVFGGFRRYKDGCWGALTRTRVEGEILEVLQDAKVESIHPSSGKLNSVMNLARILTTIKNEDMDRNPNILVFKNGTLDVSRGELRPHSPNDFAMSSMPYKYQPDAVPASFLMAISRLPSEQVAFLQEFAGYCLSTETQHEIAVFLVGPPGSGKSAIIAGIQAMMGNMGVQLGLSDLERSRFALISIVGKRLIYATEHHTAFPTNLDNLNKIVSGETLQVEQKFEPGFEYVPVAKVFYASSVLPTIPQDNGFYRRFKVIPVPPLPTEEREPDLKDRIREEAPGILNWALQGLMRLRIRGRFEIPGSLTRATSHLQSLDDTVQAFIQEACETSAAFRAQAQILCDAYNRWASAKGHLFTSARSLGDQWKRHGFQKSSIAGRAYYRGLRLRDDYEPEQAAAHAQGPNHIVTAEEEGYLRN